MPSPLLIKNVTVKVTGTGNSAAYVEARNLNTGEYRVVKCDSGGYAAFNLAELTSDGTDSGTRSGVAVGDVIEYKVQGNGYGGSTWTVTASGGTRPGVTMTAYSTTNTVGVSI